VLENNHGFKFLLAWRATVSSDERSWKADSESHPTNAQEPAEISHPVQLTLD
jgi:hypothetical protein